MPKRIATHPDDATHSGLCFVSESAAGLCCSESIRDEISLTAGTAGDGLTKIPMPEVYLHTSGLKLGY